MNKFGVRVIIKTSANNNRFQINIDQFSHDTVSKLIFRILNSFPYLLLRILFLIFIVFFGYFFMPETAIEFFLCLLNNFVSPFSMFYIKLPLTLRQIIGA